MSSLHLHSLLNRIYPLSLSRLRLLQHVWGRRGKHWWLNVSPTLQTTSPVYQGQEVSRRRYKCMQTTWPSRYFLWSNDLPITLRGISTLKGYPFFLWTTTICVQIVNGWYLYLLFGVQFDRIDMTSINTKDSYPDLHTLYYLHGVMGDIWKHMLV